MHSIYLLFIYVDFIFLHDKQKIIIVSNLKQKCAFLFEISFDINNNIHVIYYIVIIIRLTQVKPSRAQTYMVVALWLSLII